MPIELDWIELKEQEIKLRCREAGLPAASTKWEAQAQYLTFLLEKVLCIITQPAADFEAARHPKVRASEACLPAGCGQGGSSSLATVFAARTDPQCQGQCDHNEPIWSQQTRCASICARPTPVACL